MLLPTPKQRKFAVFPEIWDNRATIWGKAIVELPFFNTIFSNTTTD